MAFDRLIVETLLPTWPLLDHETWSSVASEATGSVGRAIAIAPYHVRVGVGVLSAAIGVLVTVISIGAGGPLVRAARAERLYGVLQRLPGPAGSCVRLYRSMSLLAFYEHPAVAGQLMAPRHSPLESRP